LIGWIQDSLAQQNDNVYRSLRIEAIDGFGRTILTQTFVDCLIKRATLINPVETTTGEVTLVVQPTRVQ
jgi:hypothetical protein